MPVSNVVFIAILLLVVLAAWTWLLFKKKKRNTVPFPSIWQSILNEKVTFYEQLPAPEKKRFEEGVQGFLDDVRITGVGTVVNDTDKMLVAASAVIPLFGFPGWKYRNLDEVLLYEAPFNQDYETQKGEERNILGLVGGGSMNRTMILSKPSLYQGFENQHSSHNVGVHEFVHLLDRADGATDGVPEALLQQPFVLPWIKMIRQEIEDIRDGSSDIDEYGSTNEAEFLSVVSEYFFKQPELLENRHPKLFAMLEKIFRQDGSKANL